MQCTKCGFVVPSNLRYALMKNICPSCGSALFTPKELSEINFFQSRIMAQSLAKNFDELLVFDLALFILSEVKDAISRYNMDKAQKKDSEINAEIASTEVDLAALRREVELELNIDSQLASTTPQNADPITEEDLQAAEGVVFSAPTSDNKVDKLKRIAQQTRLGNKKGPAVRRVGDD
jgi:predicted  nucleic acid-binding Zn-ribbon protein